MVAQSVPAATQKSSSGTEISGAPLPVPADPRQAAWDKDLVWPEDGQGTLLFTSHINFVIGGQDVPGVFSNLDKYQPGTLVYLFLANGHRQIYQVQTYRGPDAANCSGHAVTLADECLLKTATTAAQWEEVQNPTGKYGPLHQQRLAIGSCGIVYDGMGNYLYNVVVYAYRIA